MKRPIVWVTALTLGLAGCDVLSAVLGALSDLTLLGVTPAEGFSDAASPDRGKVRIAVGALDDNFIPVLPAAQQLRVQTDAGEDVEVEETEEVPGHDRGSFILLVDGSGSVLATDPDRVRVEAVRVMADKLASCGEGWEQSLMEFGVYQPTGGFAVTAQRADWTTDPAAIGEAAESLDAADLTPLWDAIIEVLDELERHHDRAFDGDRDGAGVGLVVLSDGDDTASTQNRAAVVARAEALDVRLHMVGFGPAADGDQAVDPAAVESLRRIADATGGYYGYVSNVDELPALAESIALAQCGGHTQLVVTWPESDAGEEYGGRIVHRDNDALAVPFSFTAPR